MGATFVASRLVFRGRTGCRGHLSEVIIEGQPWSLAQALVALRLGDRIVLSDPDRFHSAQLVTVVCDCGDVTVVPSPLHGRARWG